MEYRVIRITDVDSDELQHHGTKGMRWGIRRYQNKDGTLTDAGKKRYNKEMEKLKAEEAKVKAAEKIASNKQKTQAKLDKLDSKKAELEERKKALKGKKDTDEPEKKRDEGETVEQKHDRILKSNNAKEIYENRDVLSTAELQDRINRLNVESQLFSKIPVETKKTGMDYMNNAAKKIEAATNLYKTVDTAFNTVAKSSIGKTLAKNLGIDLPDDKKKRESLSDFVKNIGDKDSKQIQQMVQDTKNIQNLKDALKREQKEAQQIQSQNQSKNDKKNKQKQENQEQNQNKQKKTVEKKMSDAEINKKVQEAAKELEATAKKSGKTAAEVEVNEKQLEALLDEYGDFFFLN